MHKICKGIATGVVVATMATQASFASGLEETEITPAVIIAETTSSSSDDWVVPFMALLLLGAAIGN